MACCVVFKVGAQNDFSWGFAPLFHIYEVSICLCVSMQPLDSWFSCLVLLGLGLFGVSGALLIWNGRNGRVESRIPCVWGGIRAFLMRQPRPSCSYLQLCNQTG